MIPPELKTKLLSYQIPHTENIIYSLNKYKRALDASDTGTGKTYTSIVASIVLNLKPFIICPKSVISSWRRVLNLFGVTDYYITNYELLQNCRYYIEEETTPSLCPLLIQVNKH